jgi:hypothetical protein
MKVLTGCWGWQTSEFLLERMYLTGRMLHLYQLKIGFELILTPLAWRPVAMGNE